MAINKSDQFEPCRVIEGDIEKGLILLCDHARADLPEQYGTLGLEAEQFERHIAYDIGADALTRGLAAALDVPAVLGGFSRLLIDPNRGIDDPTLIMKISDGAIITGNYPITQEEIQKRIDTYYQPYHTQICSLIERSLGAGIVPMVFSIHSFTPMWKRVQRPWHAAILWDNDPRLPSVLLKELQRPGDVIIGDNEPYDGALGNDTMFKHCTRRGLANALLEVRQDLIGDAKGVDEWVGRVYEALLPALDMAQMHEVVYHSSRTGPVEFAIHEMAKVPQH